MEKAIHYFSLSANQNYAKTHFHLGLIYNRHYHVISNAIHHFSFCENPKLSSALFLFRDSMIFDKCYQYSSFDSMICLCQLSYLKQNH